MIIKATIEKGPDGLFSVYSDDHLGNSYFGGFGNKVAKAKEDFIESVKEAIGEQKAEGLAAPAIEDIQIEYQYDVPSFVNYFDCLNVSKFAEFAGINESKMRAYKSGSAYPGEKTMYKICKAAHQMAAELSAFTL